MATNFLCQKNPAVFWLLVHTGAVFSADYMVFVKPVIGKNRNEKTMVEIVVG
jgi:hypothetical protein